MDKLVFRLNLELKMCIHKELNPSNLNHNNMSYLDYNMSKPIIKGCQHEKITAKSSL